MAVANWPGMAWLEKRRLKNEQEQAAMRLKIARLNRAANTVRTLRSGVVESAMPGALVDDDSGSLFDVQAYMTKDGISEPELLELQRRIYKLYVQDPLFHAAVETMVTHIVGDRFQMRSLDHDPRTQEVWDEQANNMAGNKRGVTPLPFPTYAQNVVRQAIVFGEDFQREYVNEIDGSCYYRTMEPIWIRNPGMTWQFPIREYTPNVIAAFGIQTHPNDIQQIVTYYYDFNRNGIYTAVPAASVIHTKIGDTNMKRGRSPLLPAMKALIQLNKILQARSDMHLLRTVVAYWDTIPEGTDPEIAEELKRQLKITDGGANDGREYANEHGSTALLNGLARHYETPNLQAADAYNDIKAHVLPIARALGLTYSTFWGDTSDETQASAREASLAQTLGFESWQNWFGLNHFERVGERVINAAIQCGTLSEMSYRLESKVSPNGMDVTKSKVACERNTKFECGYPVLQVRDVKALTDALLAQYLNKIIDRREFRIQLGYQADEMEQRVDLEKLTDAEKHPSMANELARAIGNGNGTNGGGHAVGNGNGNGNGAGVGRSDEKAIYRHQGTRS